MHHKVFELGQILQQSHWLDQTGSSNPAPQITITTSEVVVPPWPLKEGGTAYFLWETFESTFL